MGDYVTNAELKASLDEVKEMIAARFVASEADRAQLNRRVEALEARPMVTTADLLEIRQAIRAQLALHRWVVEHKVRVRLLAGFGFVGGVAVGPIISAILRHFGW